jgi:transposase
MKPISIDLRKRVIESYEEGLSFGQIGLRYKMPKATVQRLIEHFRGTGLLESKPPNSGRKPAFSGDALRRLEEDVLAHPDATLAELRRRSKIKVSLVAIHNTLRRVLGFTRKKSLYMRVSNNAQT